MPRPIIAPTWHSIEVDGSRVELMTVGRGDPLLFLHGWGLSPRVYTEGLSRLCAAGIRVIAPSLPGFGRSHGLPLRELSLASYASRMGQLVDHLDLDKPVFVAGHSFGGGIGLQLAAQRPELVRSLTLVDPIGGAPSPRLGGGLGVNVAAGMIDRSWLGWAIAAVAELDPRETLTIAPRVARQFLPALARRPLTLTLTALAALRASLADEAAELIASGLPVLFVWGDRDRLVAPGGFAGLAGELPAEVVRGRHGWLLSHPEEFATLLHNALVVHALLERRRRGQPLTAGPGRDLAALFPTERRRRNRSGAAGARDRTGAR